MVRFNRGWVLVASCALLSALAGCAKEEGDDEGDGASGAAGVAAGSAGAAGAMAGAAGTAAGTAGTAAGSAGSAGTMAGAAGAAGTVAGSAGTAGTMAGAAGAAGTAAGAMAGAAGEAGTMAGAAGEAGSSAGTGGGGPLMLTSPEVEDGALIPARFRCEGPSPALAISGGPAGTLSYAIVFKDTTAAFAGTLHWIIYDIPASTTTLAEGVPIGYEPAMPAGAKQGPIYNDVMGYNGPCWITGTNTYEFELFAVDVASLPELSEASSAADIEAQLATHSLESVTLGIMSMP